MYMPSTHPLSTLPSTCPPSTLPSTHPPSTLPSTCPPSTLPSTHPPSTLPSTYPPSTLPSTHPPSTLPSTYPPSTLPSTCPPSIFRHLSRSRKHRNATRIWKDKQVNYQVGDWVFIKFPADETRPNRKLSNSWHGPYRVVTATKVYFPQEGPVRVHQQRITSSPPALVAEYYWYGPKKHSSGKVPQWVEKLMKEDEKILHGHKLITLMDQGMRKENPLRQLKPQRIRS